MTGYMNQDGSALVGGLTPSGNGQAFQIDTQGNLNIQPWMQAMQIKGRGYVANSGLLNVSAGNYPLCIFNPATSGKNVLLYSLRASSGTAASNSISVFLQIVTSNPAYTASAVVTPNQAGAASSAIAATCSYSGSTQSLAGPYAQIEITTAPVELLTNGSTLLLPSGTANGVSIFIQTYASGFSSLNAKWIEF